MAMKTRFSGKQHNDFAAILDIELGVITGEIVVGATPQRDEEREVVLLASS